MACRIIRDVTRLDVYNDYIQYRIPILRYWNYRRNYCVVSAGIANGHDNQPRAWGLHNFKIIVDYILKNTDLDVVLTGSSEDAETNKKLFYALNDSKRVINFSGQTTFEEWVEMIRNAKFVFGNDSGYIHLASILNTQSFVISGYWNIGRFLPYEKDTPDILTPIDIRVDKPECCLCNVLSCNNDAKRECDKFVKMKGTYKCIYDIKPEMVIKRLKEYMMKEGLYKNGNDKQFS